MHPFIQFKRTAPIILALALACVGLSRSVQAVSPAPDGGYANFTTAEGENALRSLTTGVGNTGLGWYALFSNPAANYNTGVGAGALALNIIGEANTALGMTALLSNTTGHQNTAVGYRALVSNTTGSRNVAVGDLALESNTTSNNTAVGYQAMAANTNSIQNVAIGYRALASTSGTNGFNVAVGYEALASQTTGFQNTAVGEHALGSLTTGTGNTAIGELAGRDTTGNGNVCIGAGVPGANVDNTTWIKNVNTTVQPAGGTVDSVTVRIADGRLGRNGSSIRYKEDVKPMDNASEVLYRLKPVTYRFKKDIDANQNLDYGLIAEDVAKIDPTLAIRDGNGQVESVRYNAINAMLLNEFLKEHRKNEQQEATITRLEKQIESLTAGLQKVSAQLELNKPVPQTVKNTD